MKSNLLTAGVCWRILYFYIYLHVHVHSTKLYSYKREKLLPRTSVLKTRKTQNDAQQRTARRE